jgi:hypothetical protein
MAIAGGEPLLYPHIVEVVEFIARNKMKPLLLTNGIELEKHLALELKRAGLAKFNFHVDSAQNRPGWEGKNEADLNELRQAYANFVWDLRGVQCGFNATISRLNLPYLPEIVAWTCQNIHKVQHLSLIALRGLPIADDLTYLANSKIIDPRAMPNSFTNIEEINISSDEMWGILRNRFPEIRPCAYLNGTTAVETNKYLVFVNVGTSKTNFGTVGSKTIELVQVFHHFFKGRYQAFPKNVKVGRKIFWLFLIDPEIKRCFVNYSKGVLKNPLRFFDAIYAQSVVVQQPFEIVDGFKNLCDGCINMMIYKGKLINSCRLDEYRLFGAPVIPIKGRLIESTSLSE